MKRTPKPKLVELQVRLSGSTQPVAKAEGVLSAGADGAIFTGFWEEPDGSRSAGVHATFPGWVMRTAGRPRKTGRDRMTGILRNYLAVEKHGTRNREIAEQLENREPRTMKRDREGAMKYIREGFVVTLDDGRKLAVALMHDGQNRGRERIGPAWTLWGGEEHAEFVADFRMVEIAPEVPS